MAVKNIRKKILVEENTMLSMVRDVMGTMMVSGLAAFLSYLFNVIAANKLPEESFAILSAIIGIVYLVQIPALTLQTYFTKAIATDKSFVTQKSYTAILKEFLFYSIIGALLVAALSPFLSQYVDIEAQYLILVSIIVLPSIFVPVLKGYLLGLKKVNSYNVFILGEAVLKIGMLLIGLLFTTNPSIPILAFGIPVLLIGIVMAIWMKAHIIRDDTKAELPKLDWKYIGLTMLTFLLFNSAFSIDVVLVNSSYRAEYAALALLGKIVFFGSVMAASVVFSYIVSSKSRKEKRRFLFLSSALNIAVSLSVVYIYMIFGKLIVETIFGGKYTDVTPYIVPFSLGIAFYSLSYIFLNYLLAEKRWLQIVLLFGTLVLQVVLYHYFNDSLADSVYNQVITYSSISSVVLLYWGATQYFEKN